MGRPASPHPPVRPPTTTTRTSIPMFVGGYGCQQQQHQQHYQPAAASAAFLVGPFLLHHNRRRRRRQRQQRQHRPHEEEGEQGLLLAAWGHTKTKTKTKTTTTTTPAPAPTTSNTELQARIPPPPPPPPASPPAAALASLPRRLVAKPLVDARQLSLSPADLQARFPDTVFAVPHTLPEALAAFTAHPSIQIIGAGLLAIVGARVWQGGPVMAGEAVAVPLTAAGWVVQEWWIHRHLLHGGWAWPGSSIHQQHHELPFYHISIDPPPVVLAWGAAAYALALALLPQPLAWTVLGVYWLMGLGYEWSHFIAHTRVRPSTRLGRAVKAHHTKHHLQDDRYWFAFSWPKIDALLGTLPSPPDSTNTSNS